MKHKGLVASLCMLFLCIESSFAGVALAQQAGPQSAQSHLTLNDVIGRIQNRLSPELIGKVLDQALTLQESGQLEFGKYIQTHLDQFDVDVVEDELMAYMPQNSTQLSTIASKLIGRDIDEQHLPAWSLVHSALLKLKPPTSRGNSTHHQAIPEVKDQNFLELSHSLQIVNLAKYQCDPATNVNNCATLFTYLFVFEGLVAALGLAKLELSGQLHLFTVAIKSAISPRLLNLADKELLEDEIPGIRSYRLLRKVRSPLNYDVPEDPEKDEFNTLVVEPKALTKEEKAAELEAKERMYYHEDLPLMNRLKILFFSLGSLLEDVVPVLFAFVTGISDAAGPFDTRPILNNILFVSYIVSFVFMAFNLTLTTFSKNKVVGTLASEFGFTTKKYCIVVILTSVVFTMGIWISTWGAYPELGYDNVNRGAMKIVGYILFIFGIISYIWLAYLRAKVRHKEDTVNGVHSVSKATRIGALLLGFGLVLGAAILYGILVVMHQGEANFVHLFLYFCALMGMLLFGLMLLAVQGFKAFEKEIKKPDTPTPNEENGGDGDGGDGNGGDDKGSETEGAEKEIQSIERTDSTDKVAHAEAVITQEKPVVVHSTVVHD